MEPKKNQPIKKVLIFTSAILAMFAITSSWYLSRTINFNFALQNNLNPVIANCESLTNSIHGHGDGETESKFYVIQANSTFQKKINITNLQFESFSTLFNKKYRLKFENLISLWKTDIQKTIGPLLNNDNASNYSLEDHKKLITRLDLLCGGFDDINLSLHDWNEAAISTNNYIHLFSLCLLLSFLYLFYSYLNYLKFSLFFTNHQNNNPENSIDTPSIKNIVNESQPDSDLKQSFDSFDVTHKALIQLIEEPESIEPITLFLYEIETLVNAESSAIFVSPDVTSKTLLTCTDINDPDWSHDVPSKILPRASKDNSVDPVRTFTLEDKPEIKFICITLHQSANDFPLLVLKLSAGKIIMDSTRLTLLEQSERLANIVSSVLLVRLKLRHAHYEERAVIARELHDSLAQSLTYLKIQASRLQNILTESEIQACSKSMEIDALMQDLRTNLNIAYRHLRDLISTFRLTMGGKNFARALKDSVSEFAKRSGIAFDIDNRLPSNLLTVTQETQLLHIIRESLSNVVRHSRAKYALISIDYNDSGQVKATIKDDGIGLPDISEREQHFGIIIMQERAHSIGGSISLEQSPGGGVCLTLTFQVDN